MIGLRESEVTLLDSRQSVNANRIPGDRRGGSHRNVTQAAGLRRADRSAQHREIAATTSACLGGRIAASGNCDGLGSRVGSFSEPASWGTGMCPEMESEMDKQSRANHIAVLKKLRDAHRSQLDDGDLSELDSLIKELEKAPSGFQNNADAALLAMRVLEAVARVIHVVTNLSDWFK